MTTATRPTLGPLMSLTCFQYLRVGTEEVADRAPVVAAGRTRGADLVKELGLIGSATDAARLHELLDAALGVNGTRLCLITSITETADGEVIPFGSIRGGHLGDRGDHSVFPEEKADHEFVRLCCSGQHFHQRRGLNPAQRARSKALALGNLVAGQHFLLEMFITAAFG